MNLLRDLNPRGCERRARRRFIRRTSLFSVMCAKPRCHSHEGGPRTDCGTENGTMAAIECTLRHHHNDHHHLECPTTCIAHPQTTRGLSPGGPYSERGPFWMELFADLSDARYFNRSHGHQCLLRYCFGDVIQKDLVSQSQDPPLQSSIMSRRSAQ